jgi:hypothetical protein
MATSTTLDGVLKVGKKISKTLILQYLFTDAAEDVFIFEQRLVVWPICHGGEKLDGVGNKEVIFSSCASIQQQVPNLNVTVFNGFY